MSTNDGMISAFTKLLTVSQKHDKEFGQPLDAHDFFQKEVIGKKQYDIETAHNNFVSSLRADRQKAETDRLIAEAKELGKAEARKEVAMSPTGQMPTDSEGPITGFLQRRLQEEGANGTGPALGSGGIAAQAAREWRMNQSA